ncbi:DNA translocase FtsK [Niveispirillum sp.]|uniref:DNA translocase FtsK n=1 Tax=Niveispirillum sp. TaxID=1917217 RepID=UPI0025F72C82|nr:DNA translocase FtsK [Niveispirillum sp.]
MPSRTAPQTPPPAGRPAPRGHAPGIGGGMAPRKSRLLPEGMLVFALRRLVEGGGLIVVMLGLALLLSFLSYDSRDPSWSTAVPGDATPVGNLLGRPGAYTSDLLLQSLGFAAYLLPLFLVGWGVRVFRHKPVRNIALRVPLALAAVLVTAMAMVCLANGNAAWGGPAGALLVKPLLKLVVALAGSVSGLVIGLVLLVPSVFLCLWALDIRIWEVTEFFRSLRKHATGIKATMAKPEQPEETPPPATPVHATRWGAKPATDTGPTAKTALTVRVTSLFNKVRDKLTARAGLATAEKTPPSAGTDAPPPVPATDSQTAESPSATPAEERRRHAPPVVGPAPKPLPEVARKVEKARQANLLLEPEARGDYELPPVDILQLPPHGVGPAMSEEALQRNAEMLESVLEDFGVRGQIVKVSPGPVVTLYELEPAPGVKSARVIGLADDIARSMSAVSVRVAVVPGRNVIGIEMPNQKRETVYLRELLMSDAYEKSQQKLALVLGKDIGGGPIIADLARMPHLLVAGTTGSGKSVAINTMILSILYRMPPDKCRFIMVDPKMLELSIYEGIPHLLAPVVTDPKKAVVALKWAVREMEDRYRNMSKLGVRNIDGYNARLKEARQNAEVLMRRVQTGFDPDTGKPIYEEQPIDLTELPYIVVIVDEMADLMLVAGKDIEAAIQRLAQMARAAGIHLIMATQRPSVDVITGTIKANFPTRISFQVTSKIDSRTILGEMGAEQLLGQGDMLYMAGGGRITRVHGPFVRDEEVEQAVKFLKAQGEPAYVDAVTEEDEEAEASASGGGSGGGEGGRNAEASGNDLYDQAVAVVTREGKASTSFIQRHLRIGYNSAARLIEQMEKEGVISKANHAGKREVLARDVDDRENYN